MLLPTRVPPRRSAHLQPEMLWGENLLEVATSPVELSDKTKLVYAPHTFGPSIQKHKMFNDPTFIVKPAVLQVSSPLCGNAF